MLHSTYSKNIGNLSDASKRLSEEQVKLLTKIRSKGRFDRLMAVLPDGWEKTFKINFYDEPFRVNQVFSQFRQFKGSKTTHERTILSIIINSQTATDEDTGTTYLKYEATPAKYDEYLKRDYDYPFEADIWKINHDLSEHTPASFHLDHKLIWVMKERSIPLDSDEAIETVPYTYSINVYVPTAEVLIEVENLKQNGVQ